MGRLLPAPEALEFSVEYAGVVTFGTGRVVEEQDEARTALQMLLDKYAPHLRPGVDYRATTDDELKRTAVYRIDIEAWSGKQKGVPEDCVSLRPACGGVQAEPPSSTRRREAPNGSRANTLALS